MVDNAVVFARSGFALEIPRFKHVELDRGSSMIELETGVFVDVRRVGPQLA